MSIFPMSCNNCSNSAHITYHCIFSLSCHPYLPSSSKRHRNYLKSVTRCHVVGQNVSAVVLEKEAITMDRTDQGEGFPEPLDLNWPWWLNWLRRGKGGCSWPGDVFPWCHCCPLGKSETGMICWHSGDLTAFIVCTSIARMGAPHTSQLLPNLCPHCHTSHSVLCEPHMPITITTWKPSPGQSNWHYI